MKVRIVAKRPTVGEVVLLVGGLAAVAGGLWLELRTASLTELLLKYRQQIDSFIVLFALLWFLLAAARMFREANKTEEDRPR